MIRRLAFAASLFAFLGAAPIGISAVAAAVHSQPVNRCLHPLDKHGAPVWTPTKPELRQILIEHMAYLNLEVEPYAHVLTDPNLLDTSGKNGLDWRREAAKQPRVANLCNANLKGMDLRLVDLTDANLSGANLSGADIRRGSLSWADLSGANMNNAQLEDANLVRSKLPFVNLSSAHLTNARLPIADLRRANLAGADFTGTDMSNVNATGANLSFARLRDAELDKAQFTGANLRGADFRDARPTESNFERADLRSAKFANANLAESDLSNVNAYRADFTSAKMIQVNLKRAYLSSANLNHADLSNSDLSFANLIRANLGASNLNAAKLSGAVLNGAYLDYANLTDADLSFASVSKAKIAYATVTTAQYAPSSESPDSYVAGIKGLATLKLGTGEEVGLVQLRRLLQDAGLQDEERAATYAIERNETRDRLASPILSFNWMAGVGRFVALDLTTAYGMHPIYALGWIVVLGGVFSLVYLFAIVYPTPMSGIVKVFPADRLDGTEGDPNVEKERKKILVESKHWKEVVPVAAYFSLVSAVNIGFEQFTPGDWIRRLQSREYSLQAVGWVRVVSGIQALLSVFLLAMWALTQFGRPFG
ncbi:MAG: pentapeptide repeat-containing protein [Candidatus Tumulicola sp.]